MPETSPTPGSAESNRAAFTDQASAFANSRVLGDLAQIQPLLDLAAITPEDRVLDAGCGTGFLLLPAARVASQVVGVDVAPAMLAEAKRQSEAAGLGNVTLREADVETLPFVDDRFDVVMTRLTLHHYANPRRALAEIYRVLRPGGRVVVCDIIASEDPAKADLHNRLERLRDPSHVRHYPADELTQLVAEAGFTVKESQQWETLRHLGEWVEIAKVPAAVVPGLEAPLAAVIPGDAAGLQAGRSEDGELTFVHHWLCLAGVK